MNVEAYVTVGIAAVGMVTSWAVWVTVMIFEFKAKIALLKQEIEVLVQVKDVLGDIRDKLGRKGHA